MTNDAIRMKADFPDWLSPMLVKELRQGMRSRMFVISFLALQAAMIFPALVGLMTAANSQSTEGVSVFFWMIVGTPLLLIMPFSGLGAISREKTGNTLELIFLTRLTARRIVFGKWVAIVAQSLLLAVAILPYEVLRYYLGGVNIVREMTGLGLMMAGSVLLTSFTVGISPAIGRVGRVILPIALMLALQFGFVISASMNGSVLRGGGVDWPYATVMTIQGLLLMLLMLEVGAGNIAPAAENHSTPKRLVALASVLTALVYSYFHGRATAIWQPAVIIAGPVLVGAVCEPIRLVPSVYRPFLRFGFAARVLGWFLYPGWPSGVFFSLLVLGVAGYRIDHLAMGAHMAGAASGSGTAWGLVQPGVRVRTVMNPYGPLTRDLIMVRIIEVAALGAFLTPPAFFRLLRLRVSVPVVFYFLMQGALGLVALLGVTVSETRPSYLANTGPSDLEKLLAWAPTCALWDAARIRGWHAGLQGFVLAGLAVVTGLMILGLLVRMLPEWRTISALEKTAAKLPPEKIEVDGEKSVEAA